MENKSLISDETQIYARETILMPVKTINVKNSSAKTNITAKTCQERRDNKRAATSCYCGVICFTTLFRLLSSL